MSLKAPTRALVKKTQDGPSSYARDRESHFLCFIDFVLFRFIAFFGLVWRIPVPLLFCVISELFERQDEEYPIAFWVHDRQELSGHQYNRNSRLIPIQTHSVEGVSDT